MAPHQRNSHSDALFTFITLGLLGPNGLYEKYSLPVTTMEKDPTAERQTGNPSRKKPRAHTEFPKALPSWSSSKDIDL